MNGGRDSTGTKHLHRNLPLGAMLPQLGGNVATRVPQPQVTNLPSQLKCLDEPTFRPLPEAYGLASVAESRVEPHRQLTNPEVGPVCGNRTAGDKLVGSGSERNDCGEPYEHHDTPSKVAQGPHGDGGNGVPVFGAKSGCNGSLYRVSGNTGSMYGRESRTGSMYGMGGNTGSMYGRESRTGSMYGMGGNTGSMYGGRPRTGSMYGMGGNTGSMYGGRPRMGSMYGMGGNTGSMYGGRPRMGSMYGMGGNTGSMYGGRPRMGSMYGMGGNTGSMYGGRPRMGSMYGMGGNTGSMYGGRPRMGSMYGMGGNTGSMYGGRPRMGSMYGMGGSTGSMYGGRPRMGSIYGMGGNTGSMYGQQMRFGSMYGIGRNTGSMYGSQMRFGSIYGVGGNMGSLYGPQMRFGSMYGADVPTLGGGLAGGCCESERCLPNPTSDKRDGPGVKVSGEPHVEPTKESIGVIAVSHKGVAALMGKELNGNNVKGCDELTAQNVRMRESPVAQAPSDNKIRTLVVVNGKVGPNMFVKASERKVGVEGIDGNVTYYESDEVLHGDEASVERSALLRMLVHHMELGHNAALVFSDGTVQQTASVGVTASVLKSILLTFKRNEVDKGTKYELIATGAEMPTVTTCRDLLGTEDTSVRVARYGSNPMLGASLMDLHERTLRSENDVDLVVQRVLANTPGCAAPGILHVTLKQIKASGTAAAVYISSLTVLFAKENADYLQGLLDMNGDVVPLPLAKGVLGGGNCVVAVVSTAGGGTTLDAKILSKATALRSVKNAPPRSGNVARFIEFAEGQLAECKAATECSKDAAARERHERTVGRLEVMLLDAKKLLLEPEGTRAAVYAPSREPHRESVAGSNVNASRDSGPNTIVSTAAGCLASPGGQPSTETHTTTPSVSPWEELAKIIVTSGPKYPDNTIEILVGGAKKVHKVDECIQRTGVQPVVSTVAKRMQSILGQGYNAALLSAEMVPGQLADEHATWSIVEEILKDVLNKRDGIPSECILQLSVLRGNEVVADLLGASERRQVVVARSPLFGVEVYGAATRVMRNAAEVGPVIATALRKAKDTLKDGGHIVCTAVLKQTTATDVKISSLFVVSAPDMQLYVDAMEGDQKYPQLLLGHALMGPCSSALLVSYRVMDGSVLKALDVQRKFAVRNSKQMDGSVKQFVNITRRSVTAAEEKLKNTSDPREREHLEQVVRNKKQALQDAQRLLENPSEAQPTAYVSSRSYEAGEVDPTVRVVAVLTDRRDGKKRNVTAKDNGFAVKTPVDEIEYPADEVVRRVGQAATIRSHSVDLLIDHFVKGYNVALLTADGDGFTSGLSMLEHTVRSVFTKKTGDAELFVALSSVTADSSSAKDLQRDGATYEKLQCASSPLFGPCVSDSRLEPVTVSETLLQKLKPAIQVCETDKSMLFCLLVYKGRRITEDDVVLSSFLLFLAGGNTDVYTRALGRRQRERGLLQYALGGPCLTAFALSLTTSINNVETAKVFGELAKSVYRSKSGTIRIGGVRRFVTFSAKALEQLRALQKKAPESDKKRLMESSANVERVLADAEALLHAPVARVPQVYTQEV